MNLIHRGFVCMCSGRWHQWYHLPVLLPSRLYCRSRNLTGSAAIGRLRTVPPVGNRTQPRRTNHIKLITEVIIQQKRKNATGRDCAGSRGRRWQAGNRIQNVRFVFKTGSSVFKSAATELCKLSRTFHDVKTAFRARLIVSVTGGYYYLLRKW